MYLENHLKNLTLYYDLYKMGKNENYVASFQ